MISDTRTRIKVANRQSQSRNISTLDNAGSTVQYVSLTVQFFSQEICQNFVYPQEVANKKTPCLLESNLTLNYHNVIVIMEA